MSAGYIVVFKPTLEYGKKGKTYTKGNVDAELVLHELIEYPNYDKAIIISGEGDFHCLVEYLEKQNKLLHIVIPNSISSVSLYFAIIELILIFILIESILNYFLNAKIKFKYIKNFLLYIFSNINI